jgi:hypothetical protein
MLVGGRDWMQGKVVRKWCLWLEWWLAVGWGAGLSVLLLLQRLGVLLLVQRLLRRCSKGP